jgi:phosphate uptake regulator
MRHRLIRQGSGGYTVYLPKKWVEGQGLKAGGEIEITPTKQGLLIQAEASTEKKEAEIAVPNDDPAVVEYMLFNHYLAGYDKMTLKGPVRQKMVLSVLPFLGGFDMTSAERREIVVESVAEPSPDKKDILLRQMFLILKEEISYMSSALRKGDEIDVARVRENYHRIGHSASILLRIMSRRTAESDGFRWTLINLLQWTGQQLYLLSRAEKGRKTKRLGKYQVAYIDSVARSLDNIYGGIFRRSVNELLEVSKHVAQEKRIYSLSAGQDVYTVAAMTHFSIISRYLVYAAGAGIGMLIMKE